jgi:hypothetical protein
MPRRRACPHRQVARSGVHRHADARSRRRRAVAGRPEAPAGPRALPAVAEGFAARAGQRIQEARRSQASVPGRGHNFDLGHGDVVIAAITSCTNTSNPSVLIGAGLLARNARRQGPEGKPWVKTSLAPGSQVVDRISRQFRPASRSRQARLQPGRLRLHHLHRQFRPAAGSRFQGDQRQRRSSPPPCCRATATSKAASSRTCGQLSGLAAAGGRLCAGRLDDQGHLAPSRSARQGRQAGLSEGHLADHQGDQRRHEEVRDARRCSRSATPTCSRATPTGARSRSSRARPIAGTWLDLCAEPALLRRHEEGAGSRSPTSSARASWRCSATRSPPTTSRRPVRSS